MPYDKLCRLTTLIVVATYLTDSKPDRLTQAFLNSVNLLQDQESAEEQADRARTDLASVHEELTHYAAKNATLEDTVSMRQHDIRNLEQDLSHAETTIRALTTESEQLRQEAAEAQDATKRVCFSTLAAQSIQHHIGILQCSSGVRAGSDWGIRCVHGSRERHRGGSCGCESCPSCC